jgi:ArsR family metal-binding transcriptional regulator
MLLNGYRKEIFRSHCDTGAQTLMCHAHLDDDVSEALPYLNAVLCGFTYIKDPPSITSRASGKLITVHGYKIAVNALKDEEEADKILTWLKNEINDAWENRDAIEPSYESAGQPNIIDILKHLPKTNCGDCHAPTCMVFATQMAEGGKAASQCPHMSEDATCLLNDYMKRFPVNL